MTFIFVYNAKSGLGNQAFDFAHKIISPSTYNCNLCALTHGKFGEKEEWTAFREESGIAMEFYHIQEFEKVYGMKAEYPVIFGEDEKGLEMVLNKEAISSLNTSELIESLKEFL